MTIMNGLAWIIAGLVIAILFIPEKMQKGFTLILLTFAGGMLFDHALAILFHEVCLK